jgi:hypothetical protein
MASYNMPMSARETEQPKSENQQSVTSLLYKPRPHTPGAVYANELFIPLYQPDRWKMFNPTEQEIRKYNMVEVNPLLPAQGEDPLFTYHLRVPVHTIEKYQHPNGSTSFMTFICPTHFNEYLTNVLGKKPLFRAHSCPFCDAAAAAWSEHNDRWADLSTRNGVTKKSLNQEGYYSVINNDPILKDTYERAKVTFGLSDRYVFDVFDYGVLTGKLQMPEEGLRHQIWLAPKTVFSSLNMLFEEDVKDNREPFFSSENPEGLQIVKVVKDTTHCKGTNFKETKYTVMKGSYARPDDAWRNYMTNVAAMADPSSVIQILSEEEMYAYAQNTKSENQPVRPVAEPSINVQMTPPSVVSAPPMIPQMPTAPAMVPPTAPAMVPPTAPAMVPPTAPAMVPPTAPAMVPPTAPAMVPPMPAMTPPMPAMTPPMPAMTPPMPAMTPPMPAMTPPVPEMSPNVPDVPPSDANKVYRW